MTRIFNFSDGFHPKDLQNIEHNDDYLTKFLDYNDLNMKAALKQLYEALAWRQKYGVNGK